MSQSEQPATLPRCSSHDTGVQRAARRIYETLLQHCH